MHFCREKGPGQDLSKDKRKIIQKNNNKKASTISTKKRSQRFIFPKNVPQSGSKKSSTSSLIFPPLMAQQKKSKPKNRNRPAVFFGALGPRPSMAAASLIAFGQTCLRDGLVNVSWLPFKHSKNGQNPTSCWSIFFGKASSTVIPNCK